MRTLLRNAVTGLYVQSADSWTCDPREALDFKTMRRAIAFVEGTGFSRMELAFASDDPQSLRTIPLASLRTSLSVKRLDA